MTIHVQRRDLQHKLYELCERIAIERGNDFTRLVDELKLMLNELDELDRRIRRDLDEAPTKSDAAVAGTED